MGYPVAGILGGLVSSTGVTFSFSRLSRSEVEAAAGLAVGVIGACTILFLRVLVATATLNSALAVAVAPYFAFPFLAGLVSVAVIWRLNSGKVTEEPPIHNPLQFWNSIEMAVLFQIVLYLVYWLRGRFGDQGFLVSGAVLGFADMDALTISMARGASGMDTNIAAQALAVGVLSNTILKTAAALIIGKGRFRLLTAAGLALIGAAIVVSLFLF